MDPGLICVQEPPVPRHSEVILASIKNAVDIVKLVGDYGLNVSRAGSKYKALCPFHDDKNPSMVLDPERQSYKCWSCGAGGDVFDFVKEYDRVEFSDALKTLADRAGIVLEASTSVATADRGASKNELLAANAWAETTFASALKASEPARAYLGSRGISDESVNRFRLGYAPGERGWLVSKAKRAGFPVEVLERAGLVSQPAELPGTVRERFRGRLMFPIHDTRGRAVGFGGRVLPEVERLLASTGKNVAKYLNSPETPLFQKRKVLYAGDLARSAAREAGWIAVVEGYTDVIAAHQVGLHNVVGTLGTALGDDHVTALRRLTEKVVLVFDGDAAGQSAADRSLELFLGHEVDVRVLTLPEKLDPCDYLLREGADAFRALVEKAIDPLAFILKRAGETFDLEALEGARQASEWVLAILAKVPSQNRQGLDVKVDKALDTMATRLHVRVDTLRRRLRELRRTAATRPAIRQNRPTTASPIPGNVTEAPLTPYDSSVKSAAVSRNVTRSHEAIFADAPIIKAPYRVSDLDPQDRDLIQLVLSEPASVSQVITRVASGSLRDAPLQTILQACYDLHGEGQPALLERVALRLEEQEVRALAAGLLLPMESGALPDTIQPASWEERLARILARLAERDRKQRLDDLASALAEMNESDDPVAYQALQTELRRLLTQRPGTKKKSAS